MARTGRRIREERRGEREGMLGSREGRRETGGGWNEMIETEERGETTGQWGEKGR